MQSRIRRFYDDVEDILRAIEEKELVIYYHTSLLLLFLIRTIANFRFCLFICDHV